jgi:hypothetical protein
MVTCAFVTYITIVGVLVASIRSYFYVYTIYTKSELDLFCMFAGTLGGYKKKKRKL